MNKNELIQAISDENVDIGQFVELVICDGRTRDEIIKQMLTNPDIMVYYHCYSIVSKASEDKPELFLQYWHEIASLLKHKNSYHRDIALTVIANLTQVDRDNLFSEIFQDYFEHIHDNKFMTGQCCVQNSLKIIKNKCGLKDQILALLLDVDNRCTYTERQKALLKCDVLEVLDQVYAGVSDKNGADAFIRACINCASPKTRRKAKELAVKYAL